MYGLSLDAYHYGYNKWVITGYCGAVFYYKTIFGTDILYSDVMKLLLMFTLKNSTLTFTSVIRLFYFHFSSLKIMIIIILAPRWRNMGFLVLPYHWAAIHNDAYKLPFICARQIILGYLCKKFMWWWNAL